ncbi:MAG TPA: ABC transporter permease [Azospirillaceae bacterium]|nr:ABC transporter permease [Azospirillaceae bacterium]
MRGVGLIARRLVAAVPTVVLVALGAYLLLELAPGDAADAYLAQTGGDAGFAAEVRHRFGLEGTGAERLVRFLGNLAAGDLGTSAVFGRRVAEVVVERLPTTLALMVCAVAFAALLGGWTGLLAGARPGSPRDRLLSVAALILLALPSFWLGLLLVYLFGVRLGWLPTAGLHAVGGGGAGWLDVARHLVLPTVALGAGYVALYMRTLRAGMVDAWRAEHVRAARARGLDERAVVWRAVARPALLPVVVLLGQQAGALFGGSVVVETVFGIPGMGRLAYEAVAGRDAQLLVGVVLVGTLVVIAANLVVDLLLARLDPRIGAADA